MVKSAKTFTLLKGCAKILMKWTCALLLHMWPLGLKIDHWILSSAKPIAVTDIDIIGQSDIGHF